MRLLVAEDEERLAASLEQGLREQGYAVDVALTGDDALAFAMVNPYDAVVLDIQLPGVDGLTVCRRLRSAGSRVPILLLTARDTTADKVVGLDSGADDYLTKPFDYEELLARVRALLRRDAPARDAQLRVADLTLDPASRLVTRGGTAITMTQREYAILETLLRRPGWIVPRDSIIESVWGYEFPDASNLVEVYIGRLRRKLGQPVLIQTVRGIGYKIEAAGDPAS